MSKPVVEVLYFEGCPNHGPAVELVERTSRQLGIETDLQLTAVPDREAAGRLRFLGSPTIRVDGIDIDPSGAGRSDYALSCRLYQTSGGLRREPDPRWLRDALRRADWGRRQERMYELAPREQMLYRALLERFAAGAPPAADVVAVLAGELDLDVGQVRRRLADIDLVHFGPDGTPLVAYPFSATPRGHRVLIDGRTWVESMCALDALGIAPMLGLPVAVHSRDPLTGATVRALVDPVEGASSWQPAEAVVLAARTCCDGPSVESCCTVLSFFESESSALRYLESNPEVGGDPISIPEAAEAGRTVFGDVLRTLAR
jgi:hypothetical protein